MAAELLGDDNDPIQPVRIEHKVDEVVIDGVVEQSYNFIDYWFDDPAGQVRARTYLDTAHKVAIYPPIRAGEPVEFRTEWQTRDAVVAYLARRFRVIEALGATGYEPIRTERHG
jgi:hypothetical protein